MRGAGMWQYGLRMACGLAVLLAISGSVADVFGGAPGSISGTVRLQGKGIAKHRIMLIRFAPGQQVARTPGQTDAAGHFVFSQLETGDAFEYVVGIRYQGTLYRSAAVHLQAGQALTDVALEVQPAAAAQGEAGMPAVYIANHLKVIVLRDDKLAVREMIRLVKSATADAAPPALQLPLPQGYGALTVQQGLAASHLRREPAGLFYDGELTAGEHRIVLSYELPFRHRVLTVLAEHVLPTFSLDVLVQAPQLIASSDLRFAGQVSFEAHTFSHFRGAGLSPQSRSWIQITRQSATLPFLREGAYGVMMAMVLLALVVSWRQRRGELPPAEAEPAVSALDGQSLDVARVRLLEEMARLDDAYESGAVKRTTYQRQRAAYKAQLIAVYRQALASQNKEVLAEGGE